MIYAANHNAPGCLPDTDPAYFTSATDAWDYLTDLHVEWEDEHDDGTLSRDVEPLITMNRPGEVQMSDERVYFVAALEIVETVHHGEHHARRVVTRGNLRDSVYAHNADYDTIVSDLINKGDADHGWCRYEFEVV